RWRLEPGQLQLFAERSRQLTVTDPQGRLLMISCGAALHHARIALAAAGWSAHVARLPDAGQPDLLATLTVTGPTAATETAARLARAIPVRHTDRRPVSDQPLPATAIDTIAAAARAEGLLHIFTPDQALALASAASRAAAVRAGDPRVRAELAYWTGAAAPPGTGLPAGVLPDHPARTTVPGRDFGRSGTLPIGTGHDKAAIYALLFGDADEPVNRLRTGEALSAAWLTATTLGVSVVPLSDVIEVIHTRQTLRHLISGLGYPHLVLRLGVADPEPTGHVHTPRLDGTPIADTSAGQPLSSIREESQHAD
ncbi:MAG TPA: NAD(P)H nitroreductase, partial [Kutzneria sp.]|nr:NAD(P)H nitroreductase [Kutzneria sp.]